MTLMFSGSRGSLRIQNDRNYLVLQVVHIVALRAQWDQKGLQWLKPTCHLCIIHIVAPVAHWGPRTLNITRFTSLPGITRDPEWLYKGRSTCGPNSGSCGSLGIKNTHKLLGIRVVHIVAPTAHWGHRKPAKTLMYLWFMQWLLRLTGDP